MSASRRTARYLRTSSLSSIAIRRTPRTYTVHLKDSQARELSTAAKHWQYQKSRPLKPRLASSTSTQIDNHPKVGNKCSPPERLLSIDPDPKLMDTIPDGTHHLTEDTQKQGPQKSELEVGEMEGMRFKVEPLRREGEDLSTMRARLLCQ
jgi:hypothetical protein